MGGVFQPIADQHATEHTQRRISAKWDILMPWITACTLTWKEL